MEPGTSRIERVIDGALLLTLPLMGLLAVFGHRGSAVVAGLAALAIALRPGVWREGLSLLAPARFRAAPLPRAAFAALLFALWIGVTGAWSPTPGAWKLAFTVAAYVAAGGALVYEASRAAAGRIRRIAALFAGAVSFAAAALLFEGLTGGLLRNVVPPTDQSPARWKDLTALARGVTYVAPLVFPAAAIIWGLTRSFATSKSKPFIAAGAVTPILFALVAATQYSVLTNVIALAFGAAAGAVALWRPRTTVMTLGALFIVSLLAAPFFVFAPADAVLQAEAAILPPSWAQRVNLWKEASDRIFDGCLWAGCGADYTRAWAADSAMIDVPGSPIPIKEAPLHPHNIFLQIWLELGIFGVLTMAAALVFGLQRLAAVEPRRVAFAAISGAAGAAYISFMLEASLWQAWRIAVLSLAAFGASLSYSLNGSRRN
jgi:O-antigen ligase